jgi:putative peptide zinc metalloprotease protein
MSAPTLQNPAAVPAGQAAEHLAVRLRPDLVVQPQFYEGMTHYVVKDPLALKYFRFKQEEYFLLQQFDGKTTLQDVKRAFERKYRPQTITVDDLLRFVAQLHEASLIQVDTAEQAKVLIKRRRKNIWKKIGQFFANILYIKIPLVDPERILTGMYPFFRWIFTPAFVFLSSCTMLAAIILVISQWSTFQAKLPEFQSFFNWRTIVYFWCSLAVIKVIHEFGHGLTAKHFGGEVHEMGMLFLVLTPALYCDVTDSWLLPSKWKRIWISAAGIYVECFLASIATFIWWNTEPGLLNSLMMATMFICSVNTIMFNANPLLRYDGYYVMSDWLEIPNLRIKSNQFFAYAFQEKILGLEVPHQHYLPKARRTLFVTYAVASYLYRWFVTFSIIFFLSQVLKPYGLQSISYVLALGSLVPLLVMPVYQIIKFVRQPGRMRKVKKARAAAWFAGAAAVVAGILLIPTPLRVKGTFVLMPANPATVYADTPGRMVQLLVRDGEMVKEGQLLAVLSNLDKLKEREQHQMEQAVFFAKYNTFFRSASLTDRGMANRSLQQAQDKEPIITKVGDQIDRLNLVAPRDGQAIGVPHPETLGQWFEPGKPLCQIADPKKLEAHLIMDQGDVDLFKVGNRAWLKIYGCSERTIRSKVEDKAVRNREEIPPELSQSVGGEIAAEPDEKTGQAKPLKPMFEVTIPVDNSDLELQPNLRGFAKIDAGYSTFGWWLWRWVTKTFHFTI